MPALAQLPLATRDCHLGRGYQPLLQLQSALARLCCQDGKLMGELNACIWHCQGCPTIEAGPSSGQAPWSHIAAAATLLAPCPQGSSGRA